MYFYTLGQCSFYSGRSDVLGKYTTSPNPNEFRKYDCFKSMPVGTFSKEKFYTNPK
jgi:hypothetical protein